MSGISYYQTLQVLSDTSSDLVEVVQTAEVELYAKVALASVLFYYTVTSMDKEVRYFWRTPWGQVDVIFFLNRYVGLLSIFISIQLHVFNVPSSLYVLPSTSLKQDYIRAYTYTFGSSCTPITWIHNIADWATVLLIDYILLLRVDALFGGSKRMRLLLYILLATEASLRLAFMICAVRAEVEEQNHLPESIACVDRSKCSERTLETVYWIAPAAYQTVTLALALYKAAEFWRTSGRFYGFRLVKVLIKDQVIYFASAIMCSIVNILKCYLHGGHMWNGTLTVVGSTSQLCLLGSVLLFNMREAGEQGLNEGTSYDIRSNTVSDINFVAPAGTASSDMTRVNTSGA